MDRSKQEWTNMNGYERTYGAIKLDLVRWIHIRGQKAAWDPPSLGSFGGQAVASKYLADFWLPRLWHD